MNQQSRIVHQLCTKKPWCCDHFTPQQTLEHDTHTHLYLYAMHMCFSSFWKRIYVLPSLSWLEWCWYWALPAASVRKIIKTSVELFNQSSLTTVTVARTPGTQRALSRNCIPKLCCSIHHQKPPITGKHGRFDRTTLVVPNLVAQKITSLNRNTSYSMLGFPRNKLILPESRCWWWIGSPLNQSMCWSILWALFIQGHHGIHNSKPTAAETR